MRLKNHTPPATGVTIQLLNCIVIFQCYAGQN